MASSILLTELNQIENWLLCGVWNGLNIFRD